MPGIFVLLLIAGQSFAGWLFKLLFVEQTKVLLGGEARTILADGTTAWRVPRAQTRDGFTVESVPKVGADCSRPAAPPNVVVTRPPRHGRVDLVVSEYPALGEERASLGGCGSRPVPRTDVMYTAKPRGEADEFAYQVWTSRTSFVERRVRVEPKD